MTLIQSIPETQGFQIPVLVDDDDDDDVHVSIDSLSEGSSSDTADILYHDEIQSEYQPSDYSDEDSDVWVPLDIIRMYEHWMRDRDDWSVRCGGFKRKEEKLQRQLER
ncbi:hypothetical protein DPMN_175341 [Dreissena polymorpha]|uniref:Uncharacterized protein n=1 Tax=Dreissena polymorpha TaxID=45954 RepID=A0A9D4E8V8_DREPO|nr:hypothetical protein DPMN_175341 [Dreissena polymorpha]